MKMNPVVKEILEWIMCVIIAIVLALLVRYYLMTPTMVKMPSMYPTLIEGERLLLNRWTRTVNGTYERGDIITFESPSNDFISYADADVENPVAVYENEPEGVWNKFVYYVLELNKKSYIKRVIGLPGENVKIDDGKVYINGEELNEPYLKENVLTESLGGAFTDITVPEGHLFLMGDNRSLSTDSRRFGCVPIDKIESKVFIRFWPFDKFGKVQ